MFIFKVNILLMLLMSVVFPCFSQTSFIRFRNVSAVIDPDYMDNARALADLDRLLSDYSIIDQIENITITGSASPDGYTARNQLLAEERAQAIKRFIIRNYPHINERLITSHSTGEDWEGLRQMIEADRTTPGRTEALRILDSALTGDEKRKLLRQLASGKTYKYLSDNMFPSLRGGAAFMIFFKKDETRYNAVSDPVDEAINYAVFDPVYNSFPENAVSFPVDKSGRERYDRTLYYRRQSRTTFFDDEAYQEKMLFAVKTNLLFDLVTALNVELEAPLGEKWSFAGEYVFPWWLSESRQYAFQVIWGNLELRRWMGYREHRSKMTGWFGGLFFGGGYFDFQRGNKGYQGEFVVAGLSGGYAREITRDGKWRMEYALGLGYLNTNYREYIPRFGFDDRWHLIRQKTGKHAYMGPVKAKITLVRTLNRKK